MIQTGKGFVTLGGGHKKCPVFKHTQVPWPAIGPLTHSVSSVLYTIHWQNDSLGQTSWYCLKHRDKENATVVPPGGSWLTLQPIQKSLLCSLVHCNIQWLGLEVPLFPLSLLHLHYPCLSDNPSLMNAFLMLTQPSVKCCLRNHASIIWCLPQHITTISYFTSFSGIVPSRNLVYYLCLLPTYLCLNLRTTSVIEKNGAQMDR